MERRIACPCEKRAPILIVDDNIFNLVSAQTIIENECKRKVPEFLCDRALNGQLAVDAVIKREQ